MSERNRYTILGLNETRVGPLALLGLAADHLDEASITSARDRQLAIVAAHPWSTRHEGLRLRDEIEAAAQILLDPTVREEIVSEYRRQASAVPAGAVEEPTGPKGEVGAPGSEESSEGGQRAEPFEVAAAPIVEMESLGEASDDGPEPLRFSEDDAFKVPAREFVDDLMAAWVSSGGWNTRARHRIVAAGARHGIVGEALMNTIVRLPELIKVTHGLQTARPGAAGGGSSGNGRGRRSGGGAGSAETNHTAEPVSPLLEARSSILAELAAAPVHHFAAVDYTALAARDAQRNFAAAFTAFIICALVTFPVAVWVLKEMFFPSGPRPFRWEDQPVTVKHVAPAPETGPDWNVTSDGKPIDLRTTPSVAPMSTALLAEINSLERDLLSASELDEILLSRLRAIGIRGRQSWISIDPTGWQRIADCMATAIYQHGQRHMDAAAIVDCISDPGQRSWDAGGVYGRAWSGGMLLYLSRLPDLPDETMTLLRSRLATDGLSNLRFAGRSMTISDALGMCVQAMPIVLARQVDALADAASTWLAWRNAVVVVSRVDRKSATSNDPDAQRDEWFLDAATHVLVDGPDVMNSERARTALAVLFSQVNWVDRSAGRRRVLAWCDDARITAADLQIVTAYIVEQSNVPGLDDSMVIAPEADAAARSAARQRLADAWTVKDDANAVTLARSDLVDWVKRVEELAYAPAPVGNQIESLARLVTLSTWNEAAELLWHGRSGEAEGLLNNLEPALAEARVAGPDPGAAPSASSWGGDGRFAIEFSHAMQANDRGGARDLIDGLGGSQPDQIGPVDAEFLVHIAMGAAPRELRFLALEQIETVFAGNATVVFSLADNLLPDRRDGRLSQAIEKITGVKLPSVRSADWYPQARIALISLTARLRGLYDEPTPTDAMIALLATSYERRTATMKNIIDTSPVRKQKSDQALAAVQRYFDECLAQARPMQPRVAVPARLDVIVDRARTRAAFFDEPVGAFAAWQSGVLELSAYIAVAERPASEQVVRAILDRATYDQIIARDAVEQLIAIERAQTILWMVRFGMPPGNTSSPLDSPMFVADQAPMDTGTGGPRFAEELAELSASDPSGYFLLGEDAADVGADALATRLFVLAATLDRDRWARSACLALAELQKGREKVDRRAELRAVATLLEDDAFVTGRRADVENAHASFRRSAAMISTMLGFYRRGEGAKALAALQFDDATQSLVERFGQRVGSLGQIISFCRSYPRCKECHNELVIKCPACHGGAVPGSCPVCHDEHYILCPLCQGRPGERISEDQIDAMLRLEIALQAGRDAPWDMRFELDGSEPRTILDPILLPRWFGIDVGRTVYRDGRWVYP